MTKWTIIFHDNGSATYLCNGKEVPEHYYRINHPSRFAEIVAAGKVNTNVSRDSDWEHMNGGRGNWISQLGKPNDPGTYHRSRHSAKEEAKRRGWTNIEDA